MSFSNLVKIAVSLKQLEENIQRAKATGLISADPLGSHSPMTDKVYEKLPKSVKSNVRQLYPGITDPILDMGRNHISARIGSHAAVSPNEVLKRGGTLRRHIINQEYGTPKRYEDATKPFKAIRKALYNQIRGRDRGENLENIKLSLSANKQKEADKAVERLVQERKKEPTRIFLNPEADRRIVAQVVGFNGKKVPKMSAEDFKGLDAIIGNHEINETNLKKFIPGGEFATLHEHGHHGLHGMHDISTINTMSEAPNAQKLYRDLRELEVHDAIKTSPGLKPVLEPLSGGQEGFEGRINKRVAEITQQNADHNKKILSKVPERLHNHPMVQARLKTNDTSEIANLAEKQVRKSGRLNRHMLKHVGNVLDKAVASKVLKHIEDSKRFVR